MHPGEPSASAASTFSQLTDAELAGAFSARARELAVISGPWTSRFRDDEAMGAILREFTRRSRALAEARARYRKRHLLLSR